MVDDEGVHVDPLRVVVGNKPQELWSGELRIMAEIPQNEAAGEPAMQLDVFHVQPALPYPVRTDAAAHILTSLQQLTDLSNGLAAFVPVSLLQCRGFDVADMHRLRH